MHLDKAREIASSDRPMANFEYATAILRVALAILDELQAMRADRAHAPQQPQPAQTRARGAR